MLETLRLTSKIQAAIDFNGFISMLKRIPLVKKLVKNVGYEHKNITLAIMIFSFVKQLIMSVFAVMILGFLGVLLPILILQEDGSAAAPAGIAYYLILIFYYLLPGCSSHFNEPNKNTYLMVKLMNMDAKRYFAAVYLTRDILRLFIEMIVYLITAAAFQIPLVPIALLLLGKHGMRYVWNVFHLSYYQRNHKNLLDHTAAVVFIAIAFLAAGYAPVFIFKQMAIPTLLMIAIGAVAAALGVYSLHWMNSYPLYRMLVVEVNQPERFLVMQNAQTNASYQMVQIKEKDFSNEELHSSCNDKRKGFDYINQIFFERHRRILYRPIKVELVLIPIATVIVLLAGYYSGEMNTMVDAIKSKFTLFIYFMYVLSNVEKATQAMFFNCDNSLMRYGVYRKPGFILKSFTLRMKKLMFANLIPAVEIAVCLFIMEIVSGGDGTGLLPVEILVLVMAVFFVIHRMFMYYILQPYTTDMLVKSPSYKVVNWIVTILCLICLNLKSAPVFLLGPIIGITVLYMIVALVCVYHFAPKTFHLK